MTLSLLRPVARTNAMKRLSGETLGKNSVSVPAVLGTITSGGPKLPSARTGRRAMLEPVTSLLPGAELERATATNVPSGAQSG